jgi:serine/threonine protein kinase/ligand-binding sensor domain-containing protein
VDPLIGRRLGAYQLLEQIGQGGMATIYKAYQPSMDRYVAVKVLPSHFTEDETFLARFTQEARTLARLEHPHILPVHDYGEQEGITYLVMRYVDAGTLKDLIAREGPLALARAARILNQVGRALDYAHSQGVVHRDIKPTNVLIDERGDAFLTDFGIAKLVAGTAQFTATGAIVGTPAYMSPEQGMAEAVDHRSDIYSLGVVLYEMVTGRVPFEAETPLAVLLQHVNAPLPPPRLIKPNLPDAVERVILKAMAKAPDDRFQSAQALVDALQKAVAGVSTEIRPPRSDTATVPMEAAERLPRTPQRAEHPRSVPPAASPRSRSLPWLPIAGGLAVLALICIIGALVVSGVVGGDGEPTATPESGVAQVTKSTTVVATSSPTTGPASVTVEPSFTAPPPTLTPTAVPVATDTPTPIRSSYPPGWTNFTNANVVSALARQGDFLWAGGPGGLVRWDLRDGSYVKLGIEDGLVSTQINDLLVDEEGDLWVATSAGINLFDGQIWRTYDVTDGLDAPWVSILFLDQDGGLWAGTAYGDRGLNYFDGTAWGAGPLPPMPVDFPNLTALVQEPEGGLLVGLEFGGLAFFDGDEWSVLTSADGLPSDQVYDLLLTDEDLWVSFDYTVMRFGMDTDETEAIPQLEYVGIYKMHKASDGSLWFAGEGGAFRYDPSVGDWEQFSSGPSTFPAWTVSELVEDGTGLWFGTHGGGVTFFDGVNWETWATEDQLGGNSTFDILEDGSGGIWFAHDGEGLSRYDPVNETWKQFDEETGALDWPSRPGVDSSGNIWIGGYGELKRYNGSVWLSFSPQQLADATIYQVALGPDEVQWLVTDVGLIRHDAATDSWVTFTEADHPLLLDISDLYVARDGTVWVGSYDGLVRYDGKEWRTPTTAGNPPAYAEALAEAPDGSLWVVGDGELYHLDGERWVRFSWPGDGWVEQLAVGPDGVVWTGYTGLGRYDPRDGSWRTYTPADGLVSSEVTAIHVTQEGVVWIGTTGGVSRFVP